MGENCKETNLLQRERLIKSMLNLGLIALISGWTELHNSRMAQHL